MLPRELVAVSGDTFHCHNWRCYWHLVCVWGGRPGMRLDTPLHMGRPRPAT